MPAQQPLNANINTNYFYNSAVNSDSNVEDAQYHPQADDYGQEEEEEEKNEDEVDN